MSAIVTMTCYKGTKDRISTLGLYTDAALTMAATWVNTVFWHTVPVKPTPPSFQGCPESLQDHV